ncbi:MAG: SMI1/KNR4 family protein [Verrucomicrobia bacterium]|nr:SMI1/KNR4 family protein [Verrucomicrobiota bacterium]
MEIPGITWRGPKIDDSEILQKLPLELVTLLKGINGFILHSGVLHVRGACHAPGWHSLRNAWLGPQAFNILYPDVLPADIPFAQDQLGDQFFLRGSSIVRLFAETGEVEPFSDSLDVFLEELHGDIEEFLDVGLSRQTQPGQLLHAYPPFCMEEAEKGVSLRAIPAMEVILFHGDLARQLRDVPEGGQIDVASAD